MRVRGPLLRYMGSNNWAVALYLKRGQCSLFRQVCWLASLTMLPESHFLLGGVLSSVLAVVGTVLNLLAMMVLVDVRLRSNPTTILVIFLTITNTIYTALVLPFNSATLLNRAYFSNHNLQCKIFAFIFYLNQVRAVEHSDVVFDPKASNILLVI